MDIELDAVSSRIKSLFQILTRCQETLSRGRIVDAKGLSEEGLKGQLEAIEADLRSLRTQRERWLGVQREIMALLGSENPDRIPHDLRNVLNNLALLKGILEKRRSAEPRRPLGPHSGP